MRLVSFNINGIRARLHQLEALIAAHQPDVIGLQETKVQDSEFPREAVEAMGYQVYFFGQKGHYGVALLTRQTPEEVRYGFPDDNEDAQRRMIGARLPCADGESVWVYNGYFPQGESVDHPTKFPHKRAFYAQLQQLLDQQHSPDQRLAVMGDFNISPEDIDIGIGESNRKRWLREGKTSFQPVEREWLSGIKGWGLVDSYRHLYPTVDDRFSWFDYRSKGFDREPKRGLRIDYILTTSSLTERATQAGIDYDLRGMEKPSDHAPVWTEFDL
ncbi:MULTISPECIES: exodeoxyribonuclease III [unclassified Halomonas]|uniref:exodeoxyribonuclease III n=1 Tax=unclassified Halomonas TaxID=2609666 RepID=UPI001C95F37C|nr:MULTISPECIES: exodeoxyribonuclease III [unclassified Halomonas]MBY5925541.1 exodeoxyribonuclease III [Halomonas sp. DP4Y7-2]MBY6232640.1 exodeoxyribonuclease III [Halomonas sp. DP4Y7-1]MED5296838.1 exodeoxyribonuclease III [Pseudomonadota bacterium]